MPIVEYKCGSCGNDFWDFFKASREGGIPERLPCPKCQINAGVRQFSSCNTPNQDYARPIEMMSLAPVDKEDVLKAAKDLPFADINIDPNSEEFGIPHARNRHEKLKIMRYFGYEEKEKRK